MSFNKVVLLGNFTRDPELRYFPKGTAVCEFSLAVNRKWKSEAGEEKEEVSFINVVAWGRQAEVIAQYLRKGKPLLVEGRLKQDTWEDKTTHEKRSALKVQLESFTFVGGNDGEKREPPVPGREAGSGYRTSGREQPQASTAADEDDQVPF